MLSKIIPTRLMIYYARIVISFQIIAKGGPTVNEATDYEYIWYRYIPWSAIKYRRNKYVPVIIKLKIDHVN